MIWGCGGAVGRGVAWSGPGGGGFSAADRHGGRPEHLPHTHTITLLLPYTQHTLLLPSMEKDNLNPTILNPSDLPSRRRESTVKRRDDGGGTGLFDDLIPRYNYLSDPFDDHVSASDSDDDARDAIDEQEIYGTVLLPHMPVASPADRPRA
jgi:hypothetical protein